MGYWDTRVSIDDMIGKTFSNVMATDESLIFVIKE